MQLITPILEEYRLKKRLKQVGSYDGDKSKTIQIGFDVNTPIAGQNYYFRPDTSLNCDKVVITEIAVVTATEQSNVQSANGTYILDNLSGNNLNQGYLCIVNDKQQVIMTIPLYLLASINNNGKPLYTWIDCQIWQNCYIVFETTTNVDTTHGIILRVTYLEKQLTLK